VWIYTDNTVAKRAWYNGTSHDVALFELVLELKHEMLAGKFVLKVVHVAGTRMIGKGTDALSRGEIHAQDLMNDEYAHSVPLYLTALQRVPELRLRLEWTFGRDISVATLEQWFEEAAQQFDYTQTPMTWVWDLPPAAGIHALEELGMGRNKRGDMLRGVVLIPRLLTPEWF
jgi:hypothetical protein